MSISDWQSEKRDTDDNCLETMAFLQQFVLLLSFLIIFSTSCKAAALEVESIEVAHNYSSKSSATENTGNSTDSSTGGDGHAPSAISTLPIVTWKWHHVETPYLVALWILTCWLCKLGKNHHQTNLVFIYNVSIVHITKDNTNLL